MTENEWKLTQARWYWEAVRISQGNVFIFNTSNIVFKKPHLEHTPFMAISPQIAHSFPYCTPISTMNNVIARTRNMSVTPNALKMLKKLSSKARNQCIVLFNLLIIRSSLRTKSLRCYMTCCGNLSNYIEILKCCDWQTVIMAELYVIGSFQKTFFFSKLSFTNVFTPK